MFHELNIRNFRSFGDLTVEGLNRINLIVGKNNVGKTAMLEAVFLMALPNNPRLPGELNRLRRHAAAVWDVDNFWGWLFHNRNVEAPASIEAAMADGRSEGLELALTKPDASVLERLPSARVRAIPDEIANALNAQPRHELRMTYRGADGDEQVSSAVIQIGDSEVNLVGKRGKMERTLQANMQGRECAIDKDVLTQFSKLRSRKAHTPVLKALKHLEPRLKDIEVLEVSGGSMLFADIGGDNLVPVSMMGEGITHIVCVMTYLHGFEAPGIYCTDGIDEGIHFSAMPSLWKLIGEAAKAKDVQFFATAHSWDCVRAAHEAFAGQKDYPLRVIRLARVDDDIEAVTHDQEMIESALDLNIEVR